MTRLRNIWISLVCLSGLFVLAGCSWIDEDRSDCGNDMSMVYNIHLVTNFNTEIQAKLNAVEDAPVADALRRHLSGVFNDVGQQLSLFFYDSQAPYGLLHDEQHTMNSSRASYVLTLPSQDYLHAATAFLGEKGQLAMELTGSGSDLRLMQPQGSLIASHSTGIFTARELLKQDYYKDHDILINLYIANCAAALVIDPRGHETKDIKVVSTGFATGFQICDSTFLYSQPSPMVSADKIPVNGGSQLCFCSVNFPSRDNVSGPTGSRTIIDTDAPFVATSAEEAFWSFHAYVTLPDGRVTETDLWLRKPLRAGQLMVVKAFMDDDGALHTDDAQVGVSIQIDWGEGIHDEIIL